jgi:hypothetical protein
VVPVKTQITAEASKMNCRAVPSSLPNYSNSWLILEDIDNEDQLGR